MTLKGPSADKHFRLGWFSFIYLFYDVDVLAFVFVAFLNVLLVSECGFCVFFCAVLSKSSSLSC